MTDYNSVGLDQTLLRLRASVADRSVSAISPGEGQADREGGALKVVSQQFESLLLNLMIREMRATVPESSLFPRSMTEEIFSDMRDERLAEDMAQHGGIGISEMIFNQLKKGE